MVENTCFITRLPPEILALIFANLSLQHRVQCLCICRSWRTFLFSWPGLWNKLSDNDGYDMVKMFKTYMQSYHGTTMRYRIDSIHIHATRRRKHKQIMRLFKEYQKRCRIQSGKRISQETERECILIMKCSPSLWEHVKALVSKDDAIRRYGTTDIEWRKQSSTRQSICHCVARVPQLEALCLPHIMVSARTNIPIIIIQLVISTPSQAVIT